MKFDLKSEFTFSGDVSSFKDDLNSFIKRFNEELIKKDKTVKIQDIKIKKNTLSFSITSEGLFRPHSGLLQIKNNISKEFGKKHHVGVRDIKIENYAIEFDLEKRPLKKVTIPFAKVQLKGKKANIVLKYVDEEFLRRNYIDRIYC